MASSQEKLVRVGIADEDNDEYLVSAIKQLLDHESRKRAESEEVASEVSSTTSTCARSTAPSAKSVTFSDSCSLWSPEDLSASEGVDDYIPPLVCQPTASTSKSSKQSHGSKATPQQKMIWEAAHAAQMEMLRDRLQMTCLGMSEWHAAQMAQWQYVACANQADQGPKQAVRWKEGDTFEVEAALITCDKSKMHVEPPARGTVMRVHHGMSNFSKFTKPKMSVKFDNIKAWKCISPKDYKKLRKVAQC